MSTTQFIFDKDQLNRLFPYYILINKDFTIESCGAALNKIVPNATQNYFTELFKIVGQPNDSSGNSHFKELGGYSMKLNLVNDPQVCLEGNLEFLKQIGKYFFTGNMCPVTEHPLSDELTATDEPAGDEPTYSINFYERVLNEVPADIVVFDTNHTYQFINPRAIKDPELRKWMIGKNDEEYCAYRNRPMSIATERRAHFKEVMQTKKLKTWEEKMTNPDGSVSYLLRNIYPVLDKDKNVEFVIGYGIDITDRKRIEEQLKINEKRYRDLYNFSPALIYTHDTDGTMFSVNPAIFSVLGYTSDEVINKNIKVLLPATDQEKIQSEYLNKVNSAGTSKGIFRLNHKNGAIKYLFYQNYKVEENDTPPYIIGFSQDITERIIAEKELLLAKRNTENLAKVKDTFLANMSHEIRTPMNGILGVTNLLAKTRLDEQQTNYANLISDSVNNLLTIINDILDMEKISSGKIEFENHSFKVVDKIKSIIQSFQYKAEQKSLILNFSNNLPSNLVIIGDPYRLAQILNNLLSNAIKFTQSGSISVSLGLVHYSDTDVIIEFVVEDTGIGIAENRISTIFDPFVKASSKFNSKFGGTGLGLSICKSLIEIQGGNIELASKINKGSTFTFNLPYKRGSSQMVSEPKLSSINFLKIEKKILVAEDIELNQFLVKTMLETWGCKVDIAVNGKEAIKKVKENDYDLILMDIQMPEMDGITATRHIRELPQANKANLPIIAFTANTLQGDSKLYKDAGMNDYITKPYSEEKLHEKLIEVLKIHAEHHSRDEVSIEQEADPLQDILHTEERLYNISMIEAIGKNNPAFVEKMVLMFVEFVGKDFDKLKEAAGKNNWTEVAQIAHKLKSTFGNMGVTTLVPYVVDLEIQTAEPLPIIEKLEEGLDNVFAQLKHDYADLFAT